MMDIIGMENSTLILRFDNRKPIRAAALADVLRDLSNDYKRIYRDELLVSISEGSLIARLKSLSKAADSANHLFDFGKNIALIFGVVAASYAAFGEHSGADKDSPLKAAESLAKLATESQSQLELSYERAGKEKLIVKLTPSEARVAKTNISKTRRAVRASSKKQPMAESVAVVPALTLKHRLISLDASPGGLKAISHETMEVIRTLVLELHLVAPKRVNELINELEIGGHNDSVQLIRKILALRKRPLES